MIDLFLFLLYFKAYLGVHRESTSGQCDASIMEDMSALSLMEREQQAIADIARLDLEERVLNLEEKRAKLLMARARRGRRTTFHTPTHIYKYVYIYMHIWLSLSPTTFQYMIVPYLHMFIYGFLAFT